MAAPAAAIGYGIGRIGCFLSGDGCYGIEIRPVHFLGLTFTPWGIAFPHGLQPIGVPVYPTPLYEFAAGLVIGWWLWRRGGKPHGTGAILGQYLILSGIARFLVEFIRRNPKVLLGLIECATGQRRVTRLGGNRAHFLGSHTAIFGCAEVFRACRGKDGLNQHFNGIRLMHPSSSGLLEIATQRMWNSDRTACQSSGIECSHTSV